MNGFNEQGERHGPWEGYFNGKLYWRENYVNGKRHGLYEHYHSNGKLWSNENWNNGKIHGLYERYLGDGKLYLKQYYL